MRTLLPFFKRRQRSANQTIAQIRSLAEGFQGWSTKQLRNEAAALRAKQSSTKKSSPNQSLVRAFALTQESLRRTTGKSFYDVQFEAGLQLALGNIVEVQTGEGKTLITALPAVLHGLSGRGVHVATTNEYLSQRDFEQLRPIYRLLGLSVGNVQPQMPPNQKRLAYQCDITYGSGYEFGFDFLRDQITARRNRFAPLGSRYLRRLTTQATQNDWRIQRPCAFAIVDEVDSVLIDEANTPLVLSGPSEAPETSPEIYQYCHDIASSLSEDQFEIDLHGRSVQLNPSGMRMIQEAHSKRPPGILARPWLKMVQQALHAIHVLQRDVDYVIVDGEAMIVDPNTGRIHDERRWRGGLHQAVEIGEGLSPSSETETDARITRQRYCNAYESVAGLTGTASGNESDFTRFYRKSVVVIPTHRPCLRRRLPDRFFASDADKLNYILKDVTLRSERGQPILIGTRSIDASQRIATAMRAAGPEFQLLNGLQDADEAELVAQAGQPGKITIATNMAGRGTDIHVPACSLNAGGLHVIAMEFHESTRVDRQLAGRSARQGNPGSCQFLAAPDDVLIARHSPPLQQRLTRIREKMGAIDPSCSRIVRRLQRKIESTQFVQRQKMVAQDDWMETVQKSLASTG